MPLQPAAATRKGPDCYQCAHRRGLPGDTHSRCAHPSVSAHRDDITQPINVIGHRIGILRGWFVWPVNFDPTWLLACDGFEQKPAKMAPQPADPGPPATAHREVWCEACGGDGKQWRECFAYPGAGRDPYISVEECEACEGAGMVLVPDEGDEP